MGNCAPPPSPPNLQQLGQHRLLQLSSCNLLSSCTLQQQQDSLAADSVVGCYETRAAERSHEGSILASRGEADDKESTPPTYLPRLLTLQQFSQTQNMNDTNSETFFKTFFETKNFHDQIRDFFRDKFVSGQNLRP